MYRRGISEITTVQEKADAELETDLHKGRTIWVTGLHQKPPIYVESEEQYKRTIKQKQS